MGVGEGGSRGRELYLQLIHAIVWQKPTEHCKVIILQLKINKIKKEILSANIRHQCSQQPPTTSSSRESLDQVASIS